MYFDNEAVLNQFERFFQMIRFKKEYEGHEFEVIIDNARTHSARDYSINDFGMKMGTRCPVEQIYYYDTNHEKQIVNCYFQNGPHKDISKGLLKIAQELKVPVPSNCNLKDLRKLLSSHAAFSTVSVSIT